jgi:hypothetical protein
MPTSGFESRSAIRFVNAIGTSRPDQKTIEISTTEKVRVAAEVATIKIRFQNRKC